MTVLTRRLQLGAFDQVPEGWVNTDITPHLFVARVPGLAWVLHRFGVIGPERFAAHRAGVFRSVRYLDVSKRFRFADDTFECVYASHMLEHLARAVAEPRRPNDRRALHRRGYRSSLRALLAGTRRWLWSGVLARRISDARPRGGLGWPRSSGFPGGAHPKAHRCPLRDLRRCDYSVRRRA